MRQFSKKVLIVKINAIGDVVMALPAATYLRSVDPHIHITWICGSTPASLLRAAQIVDEIIIVDEKHLLTGNLFQKFWALLKIWKKVAFVSFDQLFIAHLDSRYKLLTLFSRAKEKKKLSLVPGRYHSDEYVRLVSGKEGSDQCKAVLPKWTHPLPEELKFNENRPIIALAPGGAKNALSDNPLKRWPIENYVEIAKGLMAKNYPIALTGSSSDAWVLSYFSHLPVIDLIGKTTLPDLVSFYQHCSLLITHDSGPLHLGKLANIPIIALFGPTLPSHFVDLHHPNIKVIWGGEGLPCRPCHNAKSFAKCTNNLCMKNITLHKVLAEALDLLV